MSAAEIALRFGIPIAVCASVTSGLGFWLWRQDQKHNQWLHAELKRLRGETDE